MAIGIDSYLSSYLSPYSYKGTSNTSSASSVFDYQSTLKSAQAQAKEMLSSYNTNKESAQSLKKETANYLDQYTVSMKGLDQSAQNLRGANLDKLLYDSEGNVTDATVDKTVKAYQKMVDNYNNTLKLLNDNADRGSGTMKQLARMVDDPAPAASMEMVGVTVNKDGTLNLDTEKLTEALKTTDSNQLKLYKDILGGYGGIADNVHKDAMRGTSVSARDLIDNDLANISAMRSENPFREMYDSFKGNVFALNNMAAAGMMMNVLA